MLKEFLSVIAILLTFIAFFPYIRSILQNKTRPHVFSWIIWGSVTFVVFLAQLAGKGGVGAWPIGVSGLITIYVAVLAYLKKADSTITHSDWIFLSLAMTALPVWYVTSDPLYAVVILTTVDMLGFGPTIRKAWYHPFDEHLTFYLLIAIRNLVSIMALAHYSVTTMLFPAMTAGGCLVLIIMVLQRRRSGTAV